MSNHTKGRLPKGFNIDDKYNVILFIKQGSNAETYRVRGTDGELYFLKLFNFSKTHRISFDSNGDLLEIEFLKKVRHEHLVSYKDCGELIFENKKYLHNWMQKNFAHSFIQILKNRLKNKVSRILIKISCCIPMTLPT